jgi:hypothetical protein
MPNATMLRVDMQSDFILIAAMLSVIMPIVLSIVMLIVGMLGVHSS